MSLWFLLLLVLVCRLEKWNPWSAGKVDMTTRQVLGKKKGSRRVQFLRIGIGLTRRGTDRSGSMGSLLSIPRGGGRRTNRRQDEETVATILVVVDVIVVVVFLMAAFDGNKVVIIIITFYFVLVGIHNKVVHRG